MGLWHIKILSFMVQDICSSIKIKATLTGGPYIAISKT